MGRDDQRGRGIAAPLAAAAVWGIWLAPKSERQLRGPGFVAAELTMLGLATVALLAAHRTTAAIVFGAAAAINTTLVHALGE